MKILDEEYHRLRQEDQDRNAEAIKKADASFYRERRPVNRFRKEDSNAVCQNDQDAHRG